MGNASFSDWAFKSPTLESGGTAYENLNKNLANYGAANPALFSGGGDSDGGVAVSVADPSYLLSSAKSPFESQLINFGIAPGRSSVDRQDLLKAFKATKDTEGAKAYLDVDSMGKMATQLQQQAKLAGVQWDNKSGDGKNHMVNAAFALQEAGVKDIKSLRKQGDKWYQTVDGKQQEVKFPGGDEIGASAEGEGYTRYKIQADAQGRPIFYPAWESSTDKGKIAAGLGMALNLLAPGAGSALGNAIGLSGGVATAVGGGLIQGGLAAVGGASGEGILRTALSAGAAPVLGAVPGFSSLPVMAQRLLGGAVGGAIKADSSRGALLGAVTGAIPGNMTGNSTLDRLLKAIISRQIQQKVTKP